MMALFLLDSQVTSQPDLEDDDSWIEIKCATRKEPDKTVPAKVLLFGDSYKELISKKNLFLLGKDIWAKEESRGVSMKKKMRETNVVARTAVVAKQTKIKEAARDLVLQNLKTSLSQKRALATQDHHTSSEDESPQRHCAKHAKKAVRRVLPPPASNHNTSSDDATYIGSPQRPNIGNESDQDLFSTPRMQLMDDNTGHSVGPHVDEIMASLRAPLGWQCCDRSKEGLLAAEPISNEHFCSRAGCPGVQKGSPCSVHPDWEVWKRGTTKRTAGRCQSACHNGCCSSGVSTVKCL
ncbi:uncharacterized protein LOC143711128 isoform X3 [Siphateles boraxobius]|uniref:uncharacterized protein LOC143711128 isoform X3 n=1 Tax=Siphateles boraxobius TaxID=180520 RepID=UPI0040643D93